MATDLAPVTPSVLTWARRSIGVDVDEAARRASVAPERLDEWERGESEPTVAKLRQLAKFYQRPLSVFFLPEPPADFDPLRDFRKLSSGSDHSWSRALHKVYRRAVLQREIAAELLDAEDRKDHGIPALGLDQDPESAAATARSSFEVPLAEQFSWRKASDHFNGWLEAVESLGVLVLRTSEVSTEEMRGFSLGTDGIPVIVVNALDAPRGQVFTLLHEFAHLTLREGGLCDLLEPDSGEARRIEAWCNAVAGAILMPESSILDNEVLSPPGRRDWDDEVLSQLSQRYGVSREAVLLRLVTLGRATRDYYLERRSGYLKAYARQREKQHELNRSSKGGPPPHRMAIRDQGRTFLRLAIDAYHRDALTASSLSTLLGLKLKHVSALERELGTA